MSDQLFHAPPQSEETCTCPTMLEYRGIPWAMETIAEHDPDCPEHGSLLCADCGTWRTTRRTDAGAVQCEGCVIDDYLARLGPALALAPWQLDALRRHILEAVQ